MTFRRPGNDPDNAFAGCSSCHFQQHDARRDVSHNLTGTEAPIVAWWRGVLGDARMNALMMRAAVRGRPLDKKLVRIALEQVKAKLEAM